MAARKHTAILPRQRLRQPRRLFPSPMPAYLPSIIRSSFPTVAAVARKSTSQLVVTGAVNPDIARNVPVISLASGRVVGIYARLGDTVQNGQLLLRVRSDDVSGGFDAYRKAVSDELLARKQLIRTKDLFEHGAMAEQDLEVAQDAEDDAKVTLATATEHLRLLGNDP